MRMGPRTGDTTTNYRSRLWYTIEEMGISRVQADGGKWTVDRTMGLSIVDYVFANAQAWRLDKRLRTGKQNGLRGQTSV